MALMDIVHAIGLDNVDIHGKRRVVTWRESRPSDILCRKLLQEQLYTAASIILSPRIAVGLGEY